MSWPTIRAAGPRRRISTSDRSRSIRAMRRRGRGWVARAGCWRNGADAPGLGLLPQAEAAFRRALELDPDLSIAYDQAAYVDAELGRAPAPMERLLVRARPAAQRPGHSGRPRHNVPLCRPARRVAARRIERAVAVDPQQITSVAWTYFCRGDYAQAIAARPRDTRRTAPCCRS